MEIAEKVALLSRVVRGGCDRKMSRLKEKNTVEMSLLFLNSQCLVGKKESANNGIPGI